MDYIKIGLFLSKLRKEKGLTQTNLADILNVTHQAISRWETGESIPDIQTLLNLAKFYGITVDEILNGELNEKEETHKVESKEVRPTLESTLTKVSKMNVIALFLVIVGIVLFYGITWTSYYEIIGFSVQILFIISAVVLFIFGYHDLFNRTNKLIDQQEAYQKGMKYLKKALIVGSLIVTLSVLLTIPYIIFDVHTNVKSIVSFKYYISVVPYFLMLGLFLSLLFMHYIEKHFEEKYEINKMLSYNKLQGFLKIGLYLYIPFILFFVISIPFLNGNKFILFIFMGILLISELYQLFTLKNLVVSRTFIIILALLYITYNILMPSKSRVVYSLAPISAILTVIGLFVALYYLYQFFTHYKQDSIRLKIHMLSQLSRMIIFFIALFSFYLTLKYHWTSRETINNVWVVHDAYFEITNLYSYFYVSSYIIIDYVCRIIFYKTIDNKETK